MKKESGFTLIELLVVMFIIGILAGVLLPNFVSSRERARDARRKQDLAEIRTALRLYYNDHQQYPENSSSYGIVACGDGVDPQGCDWGGNWSREGVTYMTVLPSGPLEDETYYYQQQDNGDGFLLWAVLENEADAEIRESQIRCGLGATGNSNYYVCGS